MTVGIHTLLAYMMKDDASYIISQYLTLVLCCGTNCFIAAMHAQYNFGHLVAKNYFEKPVLYVIHSYLS